VLQMTIPCLPRFHGWLTRCATLLSIANAGCRSWYDDYRLDRDGESDRRKFYALKRDILLSHSQLIGYDHQRIVKTCWACAGTGKTREDEDDFMVYCWKCSGDGIFSRRHYILARYNLAGRIFHCPVGELRPNGTGPEPTIEGVITHLPSPRSWDAYRCLADLRYSLEERCSCPAALQVIELAQWPEPDDLPF
jgi:hypothetical protein